MDNRNVARGLAAALSSCTSTPPDPPQPSFDRTTPPPSSTAAPASAEPSAHGGASDPVAAATEWLVISHGISWTDPKPGAWIDRVRPVVTDRLATEYAGYRDGGDGTDWDTIVAHRCTSTVVGATGTVPSETPATTSAANVLVSGDLTTTCTAGQPPAAQKLAATVTVLRGPDGTWRVDQQVY